MNWKTLSLSTGLTLSAVLLGYAKIPASAQTAPSPSGGTMMQHSGASNCNAMGKGDAMSGGAMAQGGTMSGGTMSNGTMAHDAMKSPAGDAMSGGAMAQGGAMSGGAMASGAMSECGTPSSTAPSSAMPNSTGSR